MKISLFPQLFKRYLLQLEEIHMTCMYGYKRNNKYHFTGLLVRKKCISSKKQTFYLALSMFETVEEVVPLIKLLVLNFGPHLLGHLLIESVVMSSACFDPDLGAFFYDSTKLCQIFQLNCSFVIYNSLQY